MNIFSSLQSVKAEWILNSLTFFTYWCWRFSRSLQYIKLSFFREVISENFICKIHQANDLQGVLKSASQ